jgi:hypothetical protein
VCMNQGTLPLGSFISTLKATDGLWVDCDSLNAPAPLTTTSAVATTNAVTTTSAPPMTTTMTPPPPPTADPLVALLPPAALGGRRGFCFRNSCSQNVWVGQIGAATGIPCAEGCPNGTICNSDPTLGCYFTLPFPTNKVLLQPNQLFCLPFDFTPVITRVKMPDNSTVNLRVQWSGAMYASTGCDANGNCETGICKNCPSFRGPVGPVTQAELTLSDTGKDYYDTTLIHGANIPLVIKPRSTTGRYHPNPGLPPAYHCKSPGSPYRDGDALGSTWRFNTFSSRPDSSLVPLVAGGSSSPCAVNTDCSLNEVCGAQMSLTSENQPMPDLFTNLCGRPVGFWSRSEMCGWTDSQNFTNCKNVVGTGGLGTVQQLLKCSAPYEKSCLTAGADTGCCGCSTWDDFVTVHSEACKATNSLWERHVMPHLEQIKRGCPTCYTYPYDDSTALFTCWNGEVTNNVSYEIEWCPAGLQTSFSNGTVDPSTETVIMSTTTSMAPVTVMTTPASGRVIVVMRIRVRGTAFGEIIDSGNATLVLRLRIAIQNDIARVLKVTVARIIIKRLAVGSLVVDFDVDADDNADALVLSNAMNTATNMSANGTFLNETQAVYTDSTSAGRAGAMLSIESVESSATTSAPTTTGATPPGTTPAPSSAIPVPSPSGPVSPPNATSRELQGCSNTCVVFAIVAAVCGILVIGACGFVCCLRRATGRATKKASDYGENENPVPNHPTNGSRAYGVETNNRSGEDQYEFSQFSTSNA